MKKISVLFLAAILSLFLCACAEKEPAAPETTQTGQQVSSPIIEVTITPDNLYDFFEYREYTTYFKNDNGDVTSVQVAYGFALKDGYVAANSPEHKDTLEIMFTADGIVNRGSFVVDYTTLQYTGTVSGTETNPVSGTLAFWPKGDRTVIWPYGLYSDSYIIYSQNFTVNAAKGNIFLKNG